MESRQLMAAGPTDAEQYFLELINRARAKPAAEASRLGIALNEGLTAGTITSGAKQPLAFNALLQLAARGHTEDMLLHNLFSHVGSDGADAVQRIMSAGYAATTAVENLAWYGLALSVPDLQETVAELNRQLFLDEEVAGRGHRLNLLRADVREIGVGIEAGTFQDFNAVVATAKFAHRDLGNQSILTGVAYTDAELDDDFYTPGEGIGGAEVVATRVSDGAVFSAMTMASGGYALLLPPGQYTVNATGGMLPEMESVPVTIVDRNVKLDFAADAPGDGGVGVPKPDKSAPTAKLDAPARTRAGRSTLFRVTYRDNEAMDAQTIGEHNVRVTSRRGFNRVASFVSKVTNKNGSITATYRIDGPGWGWDGKSNGKHAVRSLGTVTDAAGNELPPQKLGVLGVWVQKVAKKLAKKR